ncbi:hypothetical protein ODJ75_09685 [Streptomyces sp. HB2AG]|nr:hypothetical protein [Streptomyces sp. HB2AG]MCZ2524952.1 hypothetical protein [Streptomyces sp. HB2AG]
MALELLVHGVGGTTPDVMLGDRRIVRVQGDDTAGLYRRTDDADAESRPGGHREEPVPEAYSWCNLTSGNSSRALWLLLLPFMVVNLAHWMRPAPAGRRPGLDRAHDLLVRLLALSLTVLLVSAACEVALDLVAWQCAGTPRCVAGQSWLGFAGADGGWWRVPGRRLALASLVPLLLVVLLWWLSRRTWTAYEAQRPPLPAPDPARGGGRSAVMETDAEGTAGGAGTAGTEEAEAGAVPALSLPGFWYGRRLVARLRAAHTAAGFLTVAVALLLPALRYDRGAPGRQAAAAADWALLALVVLTGLAVVAVVNRRGRSESVPDEGVDRLAVRALPGWALALALAAACWTAAGREEWVSAGRLPGGDVFTVLTVLQGALVAALGLVAHRMHRTRGEDRSDRAHRAAGDPGLHAAPASPPGDGEAGGTSRTSGTDGTAGTAGAGRPVLRGMGGPAVAMLACGLGGVLSGGLAQRIADWLDRGTDPGDPGGLLQGPPVLLSWQASVLPPLLAVVLALCVAGLVRLVGRTGELAEEVRAGLSDEEEQPARTRQIAGATARAELTDSAPALVAGIALSALVLGAFAVAGSAATGRVPGDAARGAAPTVEWTAGAAQSLGSWLMGAGVIAIVALGRRAYRDHAARRTVGILWDVGTFWPRAAHPFAPPCYAERAVPDLTWRMFTWTGQTGGRLVLSGHSQGSVLAAAAVWQLPPGARRNVALLTYGSPLERLYGRWFPAYLGPDALAGLHRQLSTWRNLWRRTDPIGGPVHVAAPGGEPVDAPPLEDPASYGRTVRHPLPAPVLGHFEYQADPAFGAERARLLKRLGAARRDGPHRDGPHRDGPGRAGPRRDGPGRGTVPGQGVPGRSSG